MSNEELERLQRNATIAKDLLYRIAPNPNTDHSRGIVLSVLDEMFDTITTLQREIESLDTLVAKKDEDRERLRGEREWGTATILETIRDDGWMVAVHNDYQQGGQRYTFWLFTHPDGRYLKGEAKTDREALTQVLALLSSEGSGGT